MIALIVPYLMPVLILDRADPITRLAGREVRATISGIKLRNCPPLKGSFVGWSLGPDGWREVGFDWVGDLSPDSPNPAAWGRHGGGMGAAGVRPGALAWRWPGSAQGARDGVTLLRRACAFPHGDWPLCDPAPRGA